MDLLIIVKWLRDWESYGNNPPFIINVMIGMFLTPLKAEKPAILGSATVQVGVQLFLVVVAIICIPLMLIPKPLYLWCRHRRRRHLHHVLNAVPVVHHDDEDDDEVLAKEKKPAIEVQAVVVGPPEEEFNCAEVIVHQMIHVIEFVLGAVSNTASYLRLWALSLAHSELSTVFWELIMQNAMGFDNPINFLAMFIAFAVWAAVTVLVLMCMESLSAFLHALRLHWVELMNKFYEGRGRAFAPLTHRIIEDD